MKRMILALALLMVSITAGFAKNGNGEKRPFNVNFNQLSVYLELTPSQKPDVMNITDYFLEMQSKSVNMSEKYRAQKMNEAVFGNLKLMKEVLTREQYRKYVTLLNVTSTNRLLSDRMAIDSTMMAER